MSRSPGVLIAVALAAALGIAATAAAPGSSSEVELGTAAIAGYRSAIARAAPSVVTVHSAHTVSGRVRTVRVTRIATGVIVGSDGYIVTNFHAVEDASELAVALPDGAFHPSRVVGADPESDLALLKIDVEGLRPIALADINEVAVGDIVLAMRNPIGIGQTGNSGGALIDTAGRLAGINTVILSRSGGSEGLGFATPADLVQTVAAILKSKGRVARA